jgi:hypothetical protein
MTARQKLWLFRILNFTFRLLVPVIVAGYQFGIFKEDASQSVLDKLSGGFFVILLLAFTEIKDFIQKQFEQVKLDKRVAFSKNRALLFLALGVFVLLVKMIADKAIPFLFISGASCLVAWFCENEANKYYREIHPMQMEVVVRG